MAGTLAHSPADITRRALIAIGGLGVDPPAPGATAVWPIYAHDEPDKPDGCITVYDTLGKRNGRTMPDGETQEDHGIMVMIRGNHTPAYVKARAIAVALDAIYQQVVTIGAAAEYKIQSISRTGDVNSLGKDVPNSKRRRYSINALVTVRQL